MLLIATCGIWIWKAEHGCVSQVMVNELTPLHHIVGVKFTWSIYIRNDVDADKSCRWKRRAILGFLGPPDSVTVAWKKGSLEGRVGRSPKWVLKVVTGTISWSEGLVGITWTSCWAFVSNKGFLDAKGIQSKSSLIRSQLKSIAQVLGTGDADHSVVGHFSCLGLWLEESKVVEGCRVFVHENFSSRQFLFIGVSLMTCWHFYAMD